MGVLFNRRISAMLGDLKYSDHAGQTFLCQFKNNTKMIQTGFSFLPQKKIERVLLSFGFNVG